MSRRNKRAGRPQRADVWTCVILVDFRRAATRAGRWVRGDGCAGEASYVVNNGLCHCSELQGRTVSRCFPNGGNFAILGAQIKSDLS